MGDLDGQLWRFDLTQATGSYPAPIRMALLTDAASNAHSITTAPLVEVNPVSRKRFVLVGTGRLLDTTDVQSPKQQGFYVLEDGTSGIFAAISSPIVRSDLQQVTDVTAGINLTSTSKGWYMDLGVTSNLGWRMTTSPTSFNGVVAFHPAYQWDACSPSGQSRVYALNYGEGQIGLNASEHRLCGLRFRRD